MTLSNKPVHTIIESDLADLITNQVSEGKTIDYKIALPGTSDEDKKEFLADCASFANTAGGYLIFGMDEVGGIASAICGIGDIDPEREKLRLESIIRDGLAPRIAGISIHSIQLTYGGYVLVIHVPKSWLSPHMVTYKGTSRFFARHSAGKYPLDVHEIRQSFLLSESTAEKMKSFRLNRIGSISANDTPLPMSEDPKLILHSIPLASFQTLQTVNLADISKSDYSVLKRTIYQRFNLDGLVGFTEKKVHQAQIYYQIFREGHIEFVDGDIISSPDENRQIPIVAIERNVIRACFDILITQKMLGIEPPIFIFISLVNVKGLKLAVPPHISWKNEQPYGIDRETVLIPETLLDDYPSDMDETAKILKSAFDAVWNAAGWENSFSYDQEGFWHTSS